MKTNYWLVLVLMAATVATAQTSTNALPPIPAPAMTPPPVVETPTKVPTNAPAKKAPAKKHHHKAATTKATATAEAKPKKVSFSEPSVTLTPGAAEVAAENLNVRGQAGLKGEVVLHLKKGDTVTILSEITLDKHKADEPAQWAKIALPTTTGVWVRTSFIDAATKTVTPKKLNLRAGPSEDYSVLGVIEHGTPVNEIGAKGEWSKIEAPTNAFAFVAAMYLKQEASGTLPVNPPPSTETTTTPEVASTLPPPTPTTLPESQPLVTTPAPVPAPAPAPETNPTQPAMAPVNPPVTMDTTTAPSVEDTNPPPPRVATHEGYVRHSTSLVAPTYYELFDPETEVVVDYLNSSTTNLNLSHYNGFKIIVTGEEGMTARWNDTPMLTVQRIYVVSTNLPPRPNYKSPRASTAH
jgi:uncharacterized protein YgiM (DUF1202 family)